jgi:hypothetical protein
VSECVCVCVCVCECECVRRRKDKNLSLDNKEKILLGDMLIVKDRVAAWSGYCSSTFTFHPLEKSIE